jgi:hypothetical protein
MEVIQMNDVRENKQELQTVIQALGNAAVSILFKDWERVVIGYFIAGESNVSHLQFHAITTSSDDYIDLMDESWDSDEFDDAVVEVQRNCKKIRAICSAVNDNWTAMTFTMMADGTFNIDYAYDVIEDYNSSFILNWQSQYLI